MKRIAFLSFDWDYKIVSEYYLGLQKHLAKRRGVQVVIFNAFGNYYASHLPKQSTFEIFSLYDPADYDGLLIQGNRTWPPELRQKVVDKTVAAGKPVVSINYDLEGALTVGTNNYREEYELVLRVLRDHHCTKPAFVNGLKTSVEAQARAQGYRDACAKLGITDARFYQANWQTPAGVITARYDDDLFVVVGHRTLAGQVEDELHLHEQCAPLPVSLSLDVKTHEVFASSHPSIDQLLRG